MSHPSPSPSSGTPSTPDIPLSLRQTYNGKRLLVIGGTGFLGKVWWSLLLDRFPEVEKLYLVVRPRPNVSSSDRFWREIAPHPCLAPLERRYGQEYEAFLRRKLVPIEGDITQPFCGITPALRAKLSGNIDAVVNASGIVNFQPPLDIALEVNAFGAQTVVDLAKDLGHVPILHTSTCYVAGYRTGIVEETNPLEHPFPFAGRLERAHWDADREIAECLDIIRQAKHRAGDAFRQSHFLDQAKKNLLGRGEPCRGSVLEEEIERVRRRFVEVQLSQLGQERAQFWGWPNTYTYTKSIGEQIIASSGLPFTIVRPAIIESCVDYPRAGWNEGVNTSAPIIYAIREGQTQLPGAGVRLDLIPCDLVASGMLLSLAELLEGRAKAVYQYGTSDSNPVTMSRVYELSGLYKRKHFLSTGRGGPVLGYLQAHVEGALLSPRAFDAYGPKRMARSARALAETLDRVPSPGISLVLEPVASTLRSFARVQERVASVVGQFIPFTAELDYEFRCDNTRAAYARVVPEERPLLYWNPEQLDWRDWFLNTHVPGLERHVFPELESKLRKPLKPLHRYDSLAHLLREMSDRFGHAVALQRVEEQGLTRVTFTDWHRRAQRCAQRLAAAGVTPGSSVALLADDHPDWAMGLFGILYAGAVAVPLTPRQAPKRWRKTLTDSGVVFVLFDAAAGASEGQLPDVARMSLQAALDDTTPLQDDEIELPAVTADMPALVLQTSADAPTAVRLSHSHFVSALSVVAPWFRLDRSDRLLSVQPMSGWFELLCSLLLPLSRGTRVVYPASRSQSDIVAALKQARITTLVGGSALWRLLLDHVNSQSRLRDPLSAHLLRTRRALNRAVRRYTGAGVAPLLLSPLHEALGGHVRLLINGGSLVAPEVQGQLSELGLPLINVYGTAETGPVCISKPRVRHTAGRVGMALPGVRFELQDPDVTGLGEVLVRSDGTNACLATGDLGRLDRRGRLTLIGARASAWRTDSGLWLHPTDIERHVGRLSAGDEWAAIVDGEHQRMYVVAVTQDRADDHAARGALRTDLLMRFSALPRECQPAYLVLRDTPLPRQADGDVDRARLAHQVRATLQKQAAAMTTEQADSFALVTRAVREVIPSNTVLHPETSLRVDLELDALAGLRIVERLERHLTRSLDHGAWLHCDTLADVVLWLQQSPSATTALQASGRPSRAGMARASAAPRKPAHVGALLSKWRLPFMVNSVPDTLRPTAARALLLLASGPEVLAALPHLARVLELGDAALPVLVPASGVRSLSTHARSRESSVLPYTGLRELLVACRDALQRQRAVVVVTDGGFDGCRNGLGRLVLEQQGEVVPVAAPAPGQVVVGTPFQPHLLRELVGEAADVERAAGALLERLLDELARGRVSSLDGLSASEVLTPASTPAPKPRAVGSAAGAPDAYGL